MEIWTECVGFEWDEGNSDKNWEKHAVANFECEEVFFNQPLIVRHDPRHSKREARYYALGRTDQDRLLFAAFTVRRGMIRVISAREMTRRERRFYETYGEKEGPEAPSAF
ncbi:MAG: BrnT family toxin [Terriglobia bacterium]